MRAKDSPLVMQQRQQRRREWLSDYFVTIGYVLAFAMGGFVGFVVRGWM